MEVTGWQWATAWLAAGAAGGGVFWLLARAGLWLQARWPQRLAFAPDISAAGGERERRRHRELGRAFAAVLGALLVAAIGTALAALALGMDRLPRLPSWAWMLVLAGAVALIGLGIYGVVRLALERRRVRFAWAAKAAVGNVLKRLNLAGHRVFHEVVVEGAVIDHVVLGTRGVFAINVVARALPAKAEGRPAAELRNGKLWMAGTVEALPVGDAARNMTLLSGALSKVVGHRVPVRSVLAVPGWHCVPNGAGNHLVLNESNLAMVTSWNTPDAYLMDEDCVAIQSFLHEACRIARLG